MKKSIEEIKKILHSGDYQKVLNVINDSLSAKFDLQNENEERYYSELLKLRVVAKTLAGEDDQIILDAVWKEKHPSGVPYTLDSGHIVNLLYSRSPVRFRQLAQKIPKIYSFRTFLFLLIHKLIRVFTILSTIWSPNYFNNSPTIFIV